MCVLRRIMASAVLGVFSVVLRAVGDALGRMFPPLGGLRAEGRFQGALGGFWGALLTLFGAISTSQPDNPSFFGALLRFQEALGGVLGSLLGLLGVILTLGKEPPSSKQMKTRY